MKKLLAVTALFLAFGFNSTDAIAKEKSCLEEAWEFGTENGDGWPFWEWALTDWYYENNCM